MTKAGAKLRTFFGSHIKRPAEESPTVWVERLSRQVRDLYDVAALRDNEAYHHVEMQVVEAVKQTEAKILRYARNPVKNERNLIYLTACRDVALGFLAIVESAETAAPKLDEKISEKILQYEEMTRLRRASGVDAPETTQGGLASIHTGV